MSNTQSFDAWFTQFCAILTKQGEVDKISKAFGQLDNDKERVDYVWKLPQLQEHLQVYTQYQMKSDKEATKLRNHGNKAFQKKSYLAALDLYNGAVCFADSGTNTLALAYGNRSATFYHLKEFSKCLSDIATAFECNYPDNLCFKLYERKGKCFIKLHQHEKAIESFEKAKATLQLAELEKKKFEKWLHDINSTIEKCICKSQNNTTIQNGISNGVPHPEIMNGDAAENSEIHPQLEQSYGDPPLHKEGNNETFINLASYCDVEYKEDCGRFITAKRDIQPGEVVLIEEPYASVLLPDAYSTNCHHCFLRITTAVPCTRCAAARFCSPDCLNKAEQSYHKVECEYLDLLRNSSIGVFGLLALRAVTVSTVDEISSFMKVKAADCKKDGPKYAGCNSEKKYVHDNYETIYNLVTHDKDRAVHDLFKRAVTATLLLKILEKSNFFHDVNKPEDVQIFTGGILLSHLQSFPCNAHEIPEMQLDRASVATSRPAEIAGGIYATLSLFNHSCNPAVNRNFYGDTCVVRAIRTIRAGEEISDNYGAVNAVQTRSERQTKLKNQYYFDCRCQACENDWPLYPDIEHQKPTWKCVSCGHLLGKQVALGDCGQCGKAMDTSRYQLALQKSSAKFDKALQRFLDECSVDSTLSTFLCHLACMDKYVALPWRPYNDCQEAVKQCFAIHGNCHQLSHDVNEMIG